MVKWSTLLQTREDEVEKALVESTFTIENNDITKTIIDTIKLPDTDFDLGLFRDTCKSGNWKVIYELLRKNLERILDNKENNRQRYSGCFNPLDLIQWDIDDVDTAFNYLTTMETTNETPYMIASFEKYKQQQQLRVNYVIEILKILIMYGRIETEYAFISDRYGSDIIKKYYEADLLSFCQLFKMGRGDTSVINAPYQPLLKALNDSLHEKHKLQIDEGDTDVCRQVIPPVPAEAVVVPAQVATTNESRKRGREPPEAEPESILIPEAVQFTIHGNPYTYFVPPEYQHRYRRQEKRIESLPTSTSIQSTPLPPSTATSTQSIQSTPLPPPPSFPGGRRIRKTTKCKSNKSSRKHNKSKRCNRSRHMKKKTLS